MVLMKYEPDIVRMLREEEKIRKINNQDKYKYDAQL